MNESTHENRCRVSGTPLHPGNSNICSYLADGVAESLLPIIPELRYHRKQQFLERDLETVLYELYRDNKLPPDLQKQYADANRDIEEQERINRQQDEPEWSNDVQENFLNTELN